MLPGSNDGFHITYAPFFAFYTFITFLLLSSVKTECNEVNMTKDEEMQAYDPWNVDVMSEREKEHCEMNFNITVMQYYYSSNCTSRKCIAVSFETFAGFEDCYSHYYVQLVRLGDGLNHCLLVSTVNGYASLAFQDIDIGRYELLIEPKSYSYRRQQFVGGYINITNVDENVTPGFFVKMPSFISTELLVILVAVVLLISASVFIVCKKSGFAKRKNTVVPVSMGIDSLVSFTKAIKVYILHSHDEETTRKVKILRDFLSPFFQSILIEDELPNILISKRKWLTDLLEYTKLDSNEDYTSNKRIVIVEPGRVPKDGNFTTDQDTIEDSIFREAVMTLNADRLRMLSDYRNIFVVRFEDSGPDVGRLDDVVPGERYKIPEHLIDLCLNMSPCKDQGTHEQLRGQLLAQFSDHCIRDLGPAVGNAHT